MKRQSTFERLGLVKKTRFELISERVTKTIKKNAMSIIKKKLKRTIFGIFI